MQAPFLVLDTPAAALYADALDCLRDLQRANEAARSLLHSRAEDRAGNRVHRRRARRPEYPARETVLAWRCLSVATCLRSRRHGLVSQCAPMYPERYPTSPTSSGER